ncbi:beta-phosphoglucomutase [Jeotgalibaca caeni]|uniref:beta-phosphoglucomutase n=1 Tax=Jeotgalibaca caeni TaxID=3028623 RepID=UPI00237DB87D|nr:beta-phosphoglucomutase [Jeotgalibaca caeni]MDE1548200.1 beta-phosphoglucomutase [Jeotgalibaca caeni]
MLKGIIFDLDGVITDTAEFHFLAWQKLGEKIGITFDRAFNENLKGISRMDSLDRILAYGNKENNYTQAEKEALAHEKNEHYKQLIQQISPEDLLPGIASFIKACQEKELLLALASASKNGPTILTRLGLADVFEVVVDPATLRKGKPDPEIFLQAAESLGLDSSECAGVEDAEAGIEAINRAGMFSVGVGTAEAMSGADLFVEDTIDLNLEEIIASFNQK